MNKKLLATIFLLVATLAFAAADKYISSSGNIVLKTAATKNVNLQDSVYVKQTGEVGIGTPNPATALHIYNTGSETLTLEKGNNAPSIGFKSNNSKAWSVSLTDTTSGKLGFYNNLYGASVLTLQQDGNVGIGTVSPSTTLNVKGSTGISNGVAGTLVWEGIGNLPVAVSSTMKAQIVVKNPGSYGTGFVDMKFSGTNSSGATMGYCDARRYYKIEAGAFTGYTIGTDTCAGASCTLTYVSGLTFNAICTNNAGAALGVATLWVKIVVGGSAYDYVTDRGVSSVTFSSP